MFVAGDYRLMPESNGLDIMEDLSDFWKWVRDGSLQRHLNSFKPGVEADLSKVLAYGESAGGTLAIQSGFTQPGFSMYFSKQHLLDFAGFASSTPNLPS
jgi:acetyl esterase/lipase